MFFFSFLSVCVLVYVVKKIILNLFKLRYDLFCIFVRMVYYWKMVSKSIYKGDLLV